MHILTKAQGGGWEIRTFFRNSGKSKRNFLGKIPLLDDILPTLRGFGGKKGVPSIGK